MSRSPHLRLRRRGTVLAVTLALCVSAATPALAHPFGPPPTSLVSADGNSVFITWEASADDAIAVGVEMGLLPDDLIEVYLEAPAQAAPSAATEEELTESEELRDYLEEHIGVAQQGTECDMRIQPMDNFVTDGARTVHECPAEVETVDIEITMLHDRHSAYRTFAVTDGVSQPTQAVYSVDGPVHTWDFSVEAAPEPTVRTGGLWPVAVVALLLAAGLAYGVLRGRRQRSAS